MAKLSDILIEVGATANDKKGDSLRNAFQKVNTGFTDLYTKLGIIDGDALNLGAFEFTGSTISTTDSSAITIDQAVNVSSNLNVGMEIFATNLRRVSDTTGLKQVYFDPSTGEFVVVI